MAKFRYIGNSDRPQVILKHTFTKDEWTEVPEDLAERLSTHSHLEQKKERVSAAKGDALKAEAEKDA